MSEILFEKDYSLVRIEDSDVVELSDVLSSLNRANRTKEEIIAENRHIMYGLIMTQDRKGQISISKEGSKHTISITF